MSSSVNEAPPAHLINFACGHPDASLLPIQEISDATQQVLTQEEGGRKWLQYGRENGNFQARQALAEFLATLYRSGDHAVDVDPETLCFTSGVSHGIQLICRTLLRMHQEENNQQQQPPLCWVEDPTYFLIPPIFQQSGYELDTIATNPQSGLDLEALKKKIQAARAAAPNRLLVLYTIPVHHNPVGVSIPQKDRVQLVELCHANSVYLIADEVYHGLSFPDSNSDFQPLALLQPSPYIISASAFTKILCPGIRCGWIQTTNNDLLRRIGQDGVLDSGGCCSQMASGIVAQLIQSGALATYLTSLQTEYAKRCQHLCGLLQEASRGKSYQFEFEIPQGGYFLWVRVVGIDFALDEAFQSYSRAHHQVDFKTGVSCSAATWRQDDNNQQPFSNCMRLCFAYYNTESLSAGMERLCQAIEDYPKSRSSSAL